jgi:mono/diheme cytochrome c family protein
MKLILGLVAGAAILGGGSAFAAQKMGRTNGPRAPQVIYGNTCGYCHGRNIGPVIRGRALPAEMIKMTVRHGRNGMPAFRSSEITNAELTALAKWISVSKADPAEKGK